MTPAPYREKRRQMLDAQLHGCKCRLSADDIVMKIKRAKSGGVLEDIPGESAG